MKALILAAGGGNNMAPFSTTRPKSMIHVAGRPVLYRSLQMLKESGFNDVICVMSPLGKSITDYFGTGQNIGMGISYVTQKKQTGIGDAILAAKSKFSPGEHFLLVYADVVTDDNIIRNVLQTFGLGGKPTAAICLPPETGSFGNVYLDNTMNITKIVEKPERKNLGNYVLAGIYVLPYTFFGLLEKCDGDMAKALAQLIKSEGIMAAMWEKGWIDIGYPWDILAANKMVMDTWTHARVHQSVKMRDAKIKGPVIIEEDAEIRSGSIIEGPAFIGRGTYIGNNVLVRKYSSLGPQSVIGYGVEMKNCVLTGSGRVGRLSFIGDSVVGEGVDIGSGIVTVNNNMDGSTVSVRVNKVALDSKMIKLGAFVGDRCRLGAGHTIAPGSIIEPETVVPHHFTYPKGGK